MLSSPTSLSLISLTWNCEGFSRNRYNLQKIIDEVSLSPSFIFLSEPWLHLADSPLATDQLCSRYNFFLNSEDRHDDLLSLRTSRAHGGTMTMWKKELNPFVTILEPTSSRILTIVLDKPGYPITIHKNIYLSTAGKETEFVQELALLEDKMYPDSTI